MWNGVIPAKVRHSRDISSTSKLVYVEISSMADNNCEIVINPKAYKIIQDAYSVEKRTIVRSLDELEEAGFIKTISKDLRSGIRRYTMSDVNITIHREEEVVLDSAISELEEIVNHWNSLYGTNYKCFDIRKSHIKARLSAFSKNEIMESMNNRFNEVSSSDWWNKPENSRYKTNIDTFINSDTKVDKYLQLSKIKKEEKPVITKIKFE